MVKFFKNMLTDAYGGTNSKIFVGLLSFIVAVILAFLKYDIAYVIAFLSFSAGCFGFSCFDNKSAFQFKNTDTKTETINTTKDTDIKIDAAEIIKGVKGKGKKK